VTTGGSWYCFGGTVFRPWAAGVGNFLSAPAFFEADHIRVSSKRKRGHLAGQFRIERLVDGRENTPPPTANRADQGPLARNIQLFSAQILYADAFRDRDAPRDGLWLVREAIAVVAEP